MGLDAFVSYAPSLYARSSSPPPSWLGRADTNKSYVIVNFVGCRGRIATSATLVVTDRDGAGVASNHNTSTMLVPSRSRAAICSSSIIILPSFLVPALASAHADRRAFSATTAQQSKLGRTPISIPPGVELTIGEPYIKMDYTTYKQTPRRNVSVAGPLGRWLDHADEVALGIDDWLMGCVCTQGSST